MNPPNQVLCPKCGSNQITADKKGFSGKKAVAGAIVTGGIGLLAGTIGSNKIIITCLNCGHQFKPGERPKIKPATQTSAVGFVGVIILFVLIIAVIKCSSSSTTTTMHADTDTPTPSATTISVNTPSIANPKGYEIVQTDDDANGNVTRLDVYTAKMSKIKAINEYLVDKYKTGNISTLQIFYYNSKRIAKEYKDAASDPNTSDETLDEMSQHTIGKYEWTGEGDGDLYIGKDAIDH
jgi:predicted nucleic-acid-binding Zn-ribbon protein